MMDPVQRECWRLKFIAESMRASGALPPACILDWARSMSLIAEQFCEPVEGEGYPNE